MRPGNRLMELTQFIRDVPDFPKPGVLFKDITPLLADPSAFEYSISRLAAHYHNKPVDAIAAAEARGFLFAAPLALHLRKPLIPLRKPGSYMWRIWVTSIFSGCGKSPPQARSFSAVGRWARGFLA